MDCPSCIVVEDRAIQLQPVAQAIANICRWNRSIRPTRMPCRRSGPEAKRPTNQIRTNLTMGPHRLNQRPIAEFVLLRLGAFVSHTGAGPYTLHKGSEVRCMKHLVALMMLVVPVLAFSMDNKDESFFKNAAEGGMAEVNDGKLAQDKGASQAVKDFGAMMVKDHSAANEKLTSLAARSEEHTSELQSRQYLVCR